MNKIMAAVFVSFCMLLPAGPAFPARKYAPEIKEYLDKIKKERKEERRKERKERMADPHRKLRPYQTLPEIYADVDEILSGHPEMFTGGTYGKSVQGRDLRWIRLSTGAGDKAELLISGSIHAQELAAGQMVMGIIEYFAENYETSLDARTRADSCDIYFIPVMNPDGLAKTARIQSRWGITPFIRKNANKVDLNRNFPYPADASDKLKDSCGSPRRISQTHRGPEPLSEPETRSLVEFIDRHDFILSLNYHTTTGLVLYVPGTYPDPEPDTELMEEIAAAYRAEQFNPYDVRPAIGLYPTMGAMDDFLYHHYGMLAFTVEVGTDRIKRGLIPRNGTYSPIFWSYNVYYLEREKENNVPGALAMIDYAIKLHEDPELIKWRPPEERWVGEPALEGEPAGTKAGEPGPIHVPARAGN